MTEEQWASLVAGAVALLVGIKAVVTQRISIDLDENDEPIAWVYGWRAKALGWLAIGAAAGLLWVALRS